MHGRGEDHLLLGGVPAVDGRLADTRAGGDGVHRERGVAGLDEELPGHGEDGVIDATVPGAADPLRSARHVPHNTEP